MTSQSASIFTTLGWADHLVIVGYLLATVAMGAWFTRRKASDDDYFLGGRRMPWFAVGLSVIATLLSSLTYLSEPGEVWRSGTTHIFGKLAAIPVEMVVVWFVCIPFLMRFRFTSAYEYLEHRFGRASRRAGVLLFACLVILWMGFVVLASSRALAHVTGIELWMVIATVGVVASIYTMLGGMRAVVWTDVVQVVMMLGGALMVIGFVAVQTSSGLGSWYLAAVEYQADARLTNMQVFSFDPFVRSTMVTVALNMVVWHICTHTANQMTVQRYFSTASMAAARRSFFTGSMAGVVLNLVLMTAGLAVLYYYVRWLGTTGPAGLDPKRSAKDADLIFPTFVVQQLRIVPGLAGGIMAAMLAAAMSSIDSGISSLATVLSVEMRDRRRRLTATPDEAVPEQTSDESGPSHTRPYANPASRQPTSQAASASVEARANHVSAARLLTLVLGLLMTAAAFGLDKLPGEGNIVKLMPKTFNGFIGPLGGLFFVGMFIGRAGNLAAIFAVMCGLATSLVLGYGHMLHFGPSPLLAREVSFALVVPGSLVATLAGGLLASLVLPRPRHSLAGLTWWTRHEPLSKPL